MKKLCGSALALVFLLPAAAGAEPNAVAYAKYRAASPSGDWREAYFRSQAYATQAEADEAVIHTCRIHKARQRMNSWAIERARCDLSTPAEFQAAADSASVKTAAR